MSDPTYPPAPWHMHGSMWMSVFRLARDADQRHPAGTYAVALVSYDEPSPLTYGELLVARWNDGGPGTAAPKGTVTITDIWVDSVASRAGGRELWAIPKQLCDFDRESRFRGPLTATSWTASAGGHTVVEASFGDVSRLAPRVPLTGRVFQPGIDDHPADAHVTMTGSARMLPCRARWRFTPGGPLDFLRDGRRRGSFRSLDFRLAFD